MIFMSNNKITIQAMLPYALDLDQGIWPRGSLCFALKDSITFTCDISDNYRRILSNNPLKLDFLWSLVLQGMSVKFLKSLHTECRTNYLYRAKFDSVAGLNKQLLMDQFKSRKDQIQYTSIFFSSNWDYN